MKPVTSQGQGSKSVGFTDTPLHGNAANAEIFPG